MFMCDALLATPRGLPSAGLTGSCTCSILGYLSIAIAEFIAALGLIPGSAVRFFAVLILVSIVALQWLGIRISSLFQEVTTSLKCVAFLVLVAACLLVPTDGYALAAISSSITFSGLVVALQAIVITYGGWQSPLYFIEEDRDPARNLPRTMIGGVLSVIGIYLLVNVALLKGPADVGAFRCYAPGR